MITVDIFTSLTYHPMPNYAKSKQEDLSPDQLKIMKKIVEEEYP